MGNIEDIDKRAVATPKQTSGAGFAFEDKVVAYYLCWMLIGNVRFRSFESPINRIDCQTRVDGWLLDDLLLTCINADHTSRTRFYTGCAKYRSLWNGIPGDYDQVGR